MLLSWLLWMLMLSGTTREIDLQKSRCEQVVVFAITLLAITVLLCFLRLTFKAGKENPSQRESIEEQNGAKEENKQEKKDNKEKIEEGSDNKDKKGTTIRARSGAITKRKSSNKSFSAF